MSVKKKTVISYLIPGLTIVILIALLVLALFRLSAIQREMRYNSNANMVWVIYYAQIESLRMMDSIQKNALAMPKAEAIDFRYQMLLSRINLLQDGPQARLLEQLGLREPLQAQSQKIRQLEPLLSHVVSDPDALLQVQQVLDDYNKVLLRASNEAMTTQWEELGAGVDMNRNAVIAIIFIMIGILFCSLFISVLLLIALRQARDNERVKQRQVELQKQLENERKIAELYRSFGSMVSHQFRTPLAIIDASMQRLIRSAERLSPAELQQRAIKVRSATERLTHLIESILHADRFMEQVDLQLECCNVKQLIEQILLEPGALQGKRQIQLQALSAQDLFIYCDSVLVSQIILNLLSNADKYSEPLAPIGVKIYEHDGYVCCAVQDSGRGIAKEDLPYIFQRYFRAEAVSDVIGTGIGLYVVSELAEMQQAVLSVESTQGKGTTFTVCFPRVKANN